MLDRGPAPLGFAQGLLLLREPQGHLLGQPPVVLGVDGVAGVTPAHHEADAEDDDENHQHPNDDLHAPIVQRG